MKGFLEGGGMNVAIVPFSFNRNFVPNVLLGNWKELPYLSYCLGNVLMDASIPSNILQKLGEREGSACGQQ